ncbi:MAG: protein kinase domain-containing protein [Myxococcaceae bacterium]
MAGETPGGKGAPGAPPKDLGEPIAVRSFGKYFLVRKLAEGGMAEIFLAKQVGAEGFERNVVIKRMLRHLSGVTDFVGMFLDEARLAALLAHQNIVQIYDLGQTDGCYYICMEYLAGEDFSTVLRTAGRRREYVPLSVTVRVIADAAHGLHFAHEFTDPQGKPLKLVHRDVSPSNIFVTYQGQVKLLDFGIAKAESRVTNTTAGVVKGKYMYMAPEQARGQPVDRRADVFSLGVSLYEALTNVRPFAHDNDLAILNAVLRGQYTPPRRLRPDLPPELEAVIVRALAPRVSDRYQSAAELASELEAFAAGSTSSSGGTQVASYLRQSFGEERIAAKTRIPSLPTMAASGVDVPGFSNPLATKTDPEVPVTVACPVPGETATRVARPGEVAMDSPPRRRPLLAIAAVALGACGVAFGGWQLFQRPAAAPLPPPVVERPAGQVDAGALLAVAPPPPVAAAVVDAGPAEVRRAVAPKPVQLTIADIQKIVRRGSGAITRCFEEHKEDLPGDKGQVSVTFTIVSSGKVSAAASDLGGKPVGRCLEAQVKALRFPAHRDKEVSLTLPFAYQVK